MASDPIKTSQFREAVRARKDCLANGPCDTNNQAMIAFDRLLIKARLIWSTRNEIL